MTESLQVLVDKTRRWISECDAKENRHEHCKQDKIDGEFLPTRLIDVQAFPVYLAVTSEDITTTKEPQRYLALSYCWGESNDAAKTTTENLHDRRNGIDTKSLPQTIQDAIQLTKAMGIRYLWVDALCIIQNQEDFHQQAIRIGSYYNHAYCLISATGSADSDGGLFTKPTLDSYTTTSGTIFVDEPSNISWGLYSARPHTPTMTRGWCLQERVLSPRIIHFTDGAAIWQCRGVSSASDICPNEYSKLSLDCEKIFQVKYSGIHDTSAERAMLEWWPDLVESYQYMKLTYEDDRLVAIHGLGSQLGLRHSDSYFGGVFLSHLAQGLLWRAARNHDGRKSTCCPTWSWGASKVYMCREPLKTLVDTSGYCVFPPERDMIERLRSDESTLHFSAPVLEMNNLEFERMGDFEFFAFWSAKKFRLFLQFDKKGTELGSSKHVKILILGQTLGHKSLRGIIANEVPIPQRTFERIGYAEIGTRESGMDETSVKAFLDDRTDKGGIRLR